MCKNLHFIVVLLLLVASTSQSFGQSGDNIQYLLDKAHNYFQNAEEEKSLGIYLEVLDKDPENHEALWNASVINTLIGYRSEDKAAKQEYFEKLLIWPTSLLSCIPTKDTPTMPELLHWAE